MTTKYRIIGGFLLANLVLISLAILGYVSLQGATERLNHSNRLAIVERSLSETLAFLYKTSYHFERYYTLEEAEHITLAVKSLDSGLELLRTVQTINGHEAATALAGETIPLLEAMKKHITEGSEFLNRYWNIHDTEISASLESIRTTLGEIGEIVAVEASTAAFGPLLESSANLTTLMTSFSIFRDYITADDAKAVAEALEALNTSSLALKEELANSSALKVLDGVFTQIAFLQKRHADLKQMAAEAESRLEAMRATREKAEAKIVDLNSMTTAYVKEVTDRAHEASASAQMFLLVLSIGGIIVALFFAILSIWELVRCLNLLSAYALDIAGGNFSNPVGIKEKGEVGAMLVAMSRIPAVLGNIINQSEKEAAFITEGQFRRRMEEMEFEGAYRQLAHNINNLANAYTGVLDALPVGVITLDTCGKVIFMNTLAAERAGSVPEDIYYSTRAPKSGLPPVGSYVQKTFATGQPQLGGETTVDLSGMEVAIAIATMPLHAPDTNQVAACLEILTDITEIKKKENIILLVAQEATQIAHRVVAATDTLASQVTHITASAELQRQRIETTASAMAEMNGTVVEVASNAAEASRQGQDTSTQANVGAALVEQVVHAILQVNTIASTLQRNMEELGKQAESIGSVLNVISDIADQTNLLALNAAIEAARAGEAGRGFAVVADEVRKLAENTMGATQEVGSRITSVQNATFANIQAVDEATRSISEATKLATDSGEALKSIVHKVGESSAFIASIATAAEQQSATSEEITLAIDEVNRLINQTSEGMIQSATAVRELAGTAQELRAVMQKLG